MTALFEYLVENASLWDAGNVTERLIAATERQMDSSRLYETDECYGEGGHRISLLGQHVLFEVNDEAVVSISWRLLASFRSPDLSFESLGALVTGLSSCRELLFQPFNR